MVSEMCKGPVAGYAGFIRGESRCSGRGGRAVGWWFPVVGKGNEREKVDDERGEQEQEINLHIIFLLSAMSHGSQASNKVQGSQRWTNGLMEELAGWFQPQIPWFQSFNLRNRRGGKLRGGKRASVRGFEEWGGGDLWNPWINWTVDRDDGMDGEIRCAQPRLS
jgi:hypothetical protein